MFGLTNYSGDMAEKAIELNETQPGYGVFVRYHFSRHFSAKAHAYSGSISGDDANTSRFDRKFRFATSIVEVATVAEWNILGRDRVSSTGVHKTFITPYLFGGIGVTFANKSADYYGPPDKRNDYMKVPIPEAGLNNRFVLVPVGAGLRADLMDFLVFSLEGGWRPVFSDDLDGIKINGNPNRGDWYYFAGATVSFILGAAKK